MTTQAGQTGNRCAKGHNMDPTWTECPYCQAENSSSQNSRTEVLPNSAGSGRATQIHVGGNGGGNAGNGQTAFMSDNNPSPNTSHSVAGSGDSRQVLGFLVTYSRASMPWGNYYPIRLGKNYIGAGKVGNSPGDPDCDIMIPEDKRMSSSHALILCRQGRQPNEVRFDLIDQQSSNGTYMNGDLAPLQGVTLPNYASIETGDTAWTFIKVAP